MIALGALATLFPLRSASAADSADDVKTIEFLSRITSAMGTSGDEGDVREILRARVGKFAALSEDAKGALLARLQGSSAAPVVLLAAHMDEVGFQVSGITPDGFLKVAPLGLWYAPVMLNERVVVRTARGEIPGVFGVSPPHLLTPEAMQQPVRLADMFIDLGARSAERVRDLGVELGDRVAPEGTLTRLADRNLLVSKAWDDRVGCALIADVLERFSTEAHPNTLYGAWTTWEETGRANATVEMPELHPDFVIVVEVGITLDTPGTTPENVHERLGAGPTLDLYDGTLATTPRVRDWIAGEAHAAGIPLQFTTLWQGGPGVGIESPSLLFRAPSTAILVPLRYAHSPHGLIDYRDYVHTRDLLVRLLSSLDAAKLKKVTERE